MKTLAITLLSINSVLCAHALVINEIMSNPVGDDGGREWVELYNDTDGSIDVSNLTVSVKGGSFIAVTPVSGGVMLLPRSYAIIGSTVGGITKFSQDYSKFTGPLFKSSLSLVNTGVTSLEIKVQGQTVDTLASYTAAKEGQTYSKVSGAFVAGEPTPGEDNKTVAVTQENATQETDSQKTLPQMTAPSADITLYLPSEKTVVAGAPSLFTVSALTHAGNAISNMSYSWSFGDGGARTGSSTLYRYFYPGRYVAQVEGTNGIIAGTGRMLVRVVSPEITLSTIGAGKYGSYIDITNPNTYDLDISDWKLVIDDVPFSFPRNTMLSSGVTRFSGMAMGFSHVPVSSSTLIKLLFPSMDEVLRITQGGGAPVEDATKALAQSSPSSQIKQSGIPSIKSVSNIKTVYPAKQITSFSQIKSSTTISTSSQKITTISKQKDTRIASFFRSLFSR